LQYDRPGIVLWFPSFLSLPSTGPGQPNRFCTWLALFCDSSTKGAARTFPVVFRAVWHIPVRGDRITVLIMNEKSEQSGGILKELEESRHFIQVFFRNKNVPGTSDPTKAFFLESWILRYQGSPPSGLGAV